MPVEITLPLTKLEQAVADARRNEQIMAAKVEDAKIVLKSAKSAWEEAVGEVFRAVDEMIADKRQPSLPFNDFDSDDKASDTGGPSDPTPPVPAGEPVTEPVPVEVEVVGESGDGFGPMPQQPQPLVLNMGPSWRALIVAEELDGPVSLFDTLELFGVQTMGQLADALKGGQTFNLPLMDVLDLRDAIEQASCNDASPVKFSKDDQPAITVKEKDPGDEWEEILDKRQQEAADEESKRRPEPEAEPVKAPKKRGRKPKTAVVEDTPSIDDL